MRRLALALSLLCFAPTAHAGWNEGQGAFARKDWPAALSELQPLAQNGHPGAMLRLGQMYIQGWGVTKNEAEGARWIAAAAEKGDASALNNLGGLYFRGGGVPRDPVRALDLFRRAAEQGNGAALNNLGQMYFQGNGVEKDEAKALTYLRRAADLGVSASWETIGSAYWNGKGVEKNRAEAIPWLRKAAERGHMVAQNLLGVALWTGDGAAKDQAMALKWFEAAAQQGDAASAFNLGRAYLHGAGAPKDMETGYYYLILAARQAKPADKANFTSTRDQARQSISPDQEKRAEARAEAWNPGHAQPLAIDPAEQSSPAPSPQTAAIIPHGHGGPVMAGSGIVVNSDGTVLTNAHVVPNCSAVKVSLEGYPTQSATIAARDEPNDLAILKSTLRIAQPARFREDKPLRSGDGVVAVGYPLSNLLSREPNVTAGLISAMAGLRGDARHYQITAPVQKGNSGGPLADMSGNIVGIVSAKLNAMKIAERTGDLPQNVNFAIKADVARKFMTANNVAYSTAPAAGAALSAADVGEMVRRVTVFVECVM